MKEELEQTSGNSSEKGTPAPATGVELINKAASGSVANQNPIFRGRAECTCGRCVCGALHDVNEEEKATTSAISSKLFPDERQELDRLRQMFASLESYNSLIQKEYLQQKRPFNKTEVHAQEGEGGSFVAKEDAGGKAKETKG